MEPITNLYQSFATNTKVRNQLVRQFEPLINKIVTQQSKILKADWHQLKSMGYEGFTLALNNYDPNKSKMSFMQYAAYSIFNNIRNRSYEELHIVKMTSYACKQIEDGKIHGNTFETISFDKHSSYRNNRNICDETNNLEMKWNIYESAKFADGDIMDTLHQNVIDNCNELDAKCFFQYYGICGYEEKTVQEISKELSVTSGRVSQRIKRVVKYVQQNEDLIELLGSLLNK